MTNLTDEKKQTIGNVIRIMFVIALLIAAIQLGTNVMEFIVGSVEKHTYNICSLEFYPNGTASIEGLDPNFQPTLEQIERASPLKESLDIVK